MRKTLTIQHDIAAIEKVVTNTVTVTDPVPAFKKVFSTWIKTVDGSDFTQVQRANLHLDEMIYKMIDRPHLLNYAEQLFVIEVLKSEIKEIRKGTEK